ncbi:MAG: WG repeat-containing protein [Catonella sp.]|uniref:WG repeat-containing protein n=1 Tax=Catonella sp. TaxID=2382125 RepID=UPI003F9F198C
MRRSAKIAGILLSANLFLGLWGGVVVKAEDSLQGYAYKDGKAYAVEIRGKETKVVETGSANKVSSEAFKEDRLTVRIGEGVSEKYFCIDKEGKRYGEEYDDMGEFSEGLVRVGKRVNKEEYRYGVMDSNGKLIVPMKYAWVDDFVNGMAIVRSGDENGEVAKVGAVDKNGKEVVPLKYDNINSFNKYGFAVVAVSWNENSRGLINQKGEMVISPQYNMFYEIEGSELYKTEKIEGERTTYGLMNYKGELVASNKYSNVEIYDDLKLVVLKNTNENGIMDKVGMIDYEGKNLLPFDASYISDRQEKGVFFVRKGENEEARFGMVDAKGKELYPFTLSTHDNFEHGLARVSKGVNYDQWGLLDASGKEIVPCEDDYIFPFSEGLATFKDKDGKYGFYDTKGKVALDLGKEYSGLEYFSDGLCAVKKKGKYGYIDKKGKLVIPCKFDEVDLFIRGLARIYKTDKMGNRRIGLINKKGKQVTPVQYTDIEYKDSGEIKVGLKDNYITKYGFLDKNGKMIVPPKYNEVYSYHDKAGIVSILKSNGDVKFGLADKSGKLDKTIKFDDIYTPYKGMFKTVKNSKYGMMDVKGKELLKPIYTDIENYPENGVDLAVISKNGKQGLINEKGKIVLPIKYNDIFINENGAKIVVGKGYKDYKYGFVNKKGKIILKPQYTYIGSFEKGMAIVAKNEKEGYVNLKGEIVIPLKYDWIGSFMNNDHVIAEKKGKYGMLDKKGKELIPLQYEGIEVISENLYLVKKNGKYGYLDKDGKVIIPTEFDYILVK